MKTQLLTILLLGATNLFAQHSSITQVDDNVLTPEEKFVADNFPFIHMADWKKGMRFLVEAKPADGADDLEIDSNLKRKGSDASVIHNLYENKIFTVETLEERHTPKQSHVLNTFVLFDCEGEKFEYSFAGSMEQMRRSENLPTIDHLIYLDDIEKAEELLLNNHLRLKYTLNDQNLVIVTKVEANTSSNPVKIVYKTVTGNEVAVEIVLSGTNVARKEIAENFAEYFLMEQTKKGKRKNEKQLEDDNTVFTKVDVQPEFVGGLQSMINFIQRNMNASCCQGMSGTVYVSFVVTKNGLIDDVKTIRGVGTKCDDEAMRVVSTMPTWKPGKAKNKLVNVRFVMPILIR